MYLCLRSIMDMPRVAVRILSAYPETFLTDKIDLVLMVVADIDTRLKSKTPASLI